MEKIPTDEDEKIEITKYIITSIINLDVSHNGLSDKGARILIEHLNKYTELSISGNPNISLELADKIRSKFVHNPSSSSHPIGIDLGLNIFSSLPTNFSEILMKIAL